jgi:hypothetical protein
MIRWTIGDSSEDEEEEKAPDTVRDPQVCESCSCVLNKPTPCCRFKDDGK